MCHYPFEPARFPPGLIFPPALWSFPHLRKLFWSAVLTAVSSFLISQFPCQPHQYYQWLLLHRLPGDPILLWAVQLFIFFRAIDSHIWLPISICTTDFFRIIIQHFRIAVFILPPWQNRLYQNRDSIFYESANLLSDGFLIIDHCYIQNLSPFVRYRGGANANHRVSILTLFPPLSNRQTAAYGCEP